MTQLIKKIPIGVKIFGIAFSMLILLIILSYFTYIRTAQVTGELIEVTDYLIPVENLLTDINVHTLEQEIHLERVWRIYETKPVKLEQINQEIEAFEERGRSVDQNITEVIDLLDQAITHV